MRLNDIDICNHAIGLCGSADWIQSIGDTGSPASLRCERFFQTAVENVLRKHDWGCATAIVQLAESTTAPTADRENIFPLPNDCIRVIQVYSQDSGYCPYDRWRKVGQNIHTDLETVYLRYIQLPEDHKTLDTLLSTAIAYELATFLAPTLVRNPEIYAILKNAQVRALAEAKAVDTMEQKFINVENDVLEDNRLNVGT